jgi:hypothetical protein
VGGRGAGGERKEKGERQSRLGRLRPGGPPCQPPPGGHLTVFTASSHARAQTNTAIMTPHTSRDVIHNSMTSHTSRRTHLAASALAGGEILLQPSDEFGRHQPQRLKRGRLQAVAARVLGYGYGYGYGYGRVRNARGGGHKAEAGDSKRHWQDSWWRRTW